MQIQTSLVFTATLTLFASVTALSAQQIPAIAQDPPPDKEFPASTEAPDIPSHGARLNAVFYLASGREPKAVVLLMHGFPGNEQNMDLAYAIRREGWNVLVPHYRGSWGSQGNFSFSNCIEDTQAAIEFLRDAENVKKYRIDPKRIVAIGHSMGGFMVTVITNWRGRITVIVVAVVVVAVIISILGPRITCPKDANRQQRKIS
jgi:uncharacterized protein